MTPQVMDATIKDREEEVLSDPSATWAPYLTMLGEPYDRGGDDGVPRLLTDPRQLIRARRPFALAGLLAVLLALAVASSACRSKESETESAAQTAKVAELRTVSELRERFNHDSGKVRLILLISPT